MVVVHGRTRSASGCAGGLGVRRGLLHLPNAGEVGAGQWRSVERERCGHPRSRRPRCTSPLRGGCAAAFSTAMRSLNTGSFGPPPRCRVWLSSSLIIFANAKTLSASTARSCRFSPDADVERERLPEVERRVDRLGAEDRLERPSARAGRPSAIRRRWAAPPPRRAPRVLAGRGDLDRPGQRPLAPAGCGLP